MRFTCIVRSPKMALSLIQRPHGGFTDPAAGDSGVGSPDRLSDLKYPTTGVIGHDAEVLGCEFSPDGNHFATCSADKTILRDHASVLYNTFGDCDNFGVLRGHKNPVLEVHWMPSGRELVSASADKDLALWDAVTCQRIKRFQGHKGIVNSCSVAKDAQQGGDLMASASDDKTVKVWDLRTRKCAVTFEFGYQCLSVALDEKRQRVFVGGLDHSIKICDLRFGQSSAAKEEARVPTTLQGRGHSDCVTGLDLSVDGTKLLSTGMDSLVRLWNVQPFYPGEDRCVQAFRGASLHNNERTLLRVRWNKNGDKFAAGSACRHINVFDAGLMRGIYRLPGHKGSIQDVSFHPTQPIVLAASADRTATLRELPNEILMPEESSSEEETSDDDSDVSME